MGMEMGQEREAGREVGWLKEHERRDFCRGGCGCDLEAGSGVENGKGMMKERTLVPRDTGGGRLFGLPANGNRLHLVHPLHPSARPPANLVQSRPSVVHPRW